MKRAANGYTVVELITVMVVIGILSAIAIPRISQTTEFAASAYRSQVVSALRHAQKSAVSHRHRVCVTLGQSNVGIKIASDPSVANCDLNLTSLYSDPNFYGSKDKAAIASGPLVNGSQPTMFFQPNGEIWDSTGNIINAGSIGITGMRPIRIDGSTGYVE